ncbi:MAG: head GIN domain-containing protein [Anaerolineaceae bacterium]
MKAKIKIVLIVAMVLMATLACSIPSITTPRIELGSGKEISEDRAVEAFSGIDFSGGGSIKLVHGTEYKLNISGEDNVLDNITSEVKNGVLVIDFKRDVGATFSTKDVVFTITYIDINKLEVNGGAMIESENLGVQNLQLVINGGGSTTLKSQGMDALDVRLDGGNNFVISGQATSQTVEINGGGNYNASDLKTETASISMTGAGNADIWATDTLSAKIVGVGKISYWGNPIVTQAVNGLGLIESQGEK